MMKSHAMLGRTIPTVLITLSVIALILLVATPAMNDIVEQERAMRVVKFVEHLEEACRRHHDDTGRLALEYAPRDAEDSYNAKRYHHLSTPQYYPGWEGPYLELGLTMGDNPWGGRVELRRDLSTHPALGFRLGAALAEEKGQYLMLTGIPARAAELIEQQIDGEEMIADWAAQGRVEYALDDGGTLSILLMDVEN